MHDRVQSSTIPYLIWRYSPVVNDHLTPGCPDHSCLGFCFQHHLWVSSNAGFFTGALAFFPLSFVIRAINVSFTNAQYRHFWGWYVRDRILPSLLILSITFPSIVSRRGAGAHSAYLWPSLSPPHKRFICELVTVSFHVVISLFGSWDINFLNTNFVSWPHTINIPWPSWLVWESWDLSFDTHW